MKNQNEDRQGRQSRFAVIVTVTLALHFVQVFGEVKFNLNSTAFKYSPICSAYPRQSYHKQVPPFLFIFR